MGPHIEELLDNLNAILAQVPVELRGASFQRTLEGFAMQENTRRIELALAILWAYRNSELGGNLLTHILHGATIAGREPDLQADLLPKSEREWKVANVAAASVIQWLATSVGCAFLQQAFKSAGGKLSYELPDTTGHESVGR